MKYYDTADWSICQFGHNGIWFVPGHFEPDGYFKIVGPKIEEPEEVGG